MDNNENVKEKVTEGDSARKGRIDLTELEEQFKDGLNWDDMNTMDLIAELKRMYEREDFLMEARKVWLIEERRLEKKVEASQKEMLQSFVRTSDTEKALRQALSTIRDDLDEVMSKYPLRRRPAYDSEVKKDEFLKKIRNFANDAS